MSSSPPTTRYLPLFDDPIGQLRVCIESMGALRSEGVNEIRVNFERVSLLGSMMLGLLVRMHMVCQREAIALKLEGLSEPMLKTLAISGIGTMLGVPPPKSAP